MYTAILTVNAIKHVVTLFTKDDAGQPLVMDNDVSPHSGEHHMLEVICY